MLTLPLPRRITGRAEATGPVILITTTSPHPMSQAKSPPIALILGTRNRKKGGEMVQLLRPPWEPNPRLGRLAIATLDDYPGVPEVVEDADTFEGNARKKAGET